MAMENPSVSPQCKPASNAAFAQAEQVKPSLPGIIVLNYNYFPKTFHSPAKVGATAFALAAVQVLKQLKLFRGVILYKRQEGICKPTVTLETRNSVLCATVSFSFEMDTKLMKRAIGTTSELLARNDNVHPMLYYQTDTLLEYHPEYLPLCVTHHAPFYEDFARHFSEELASAAFGTQEKAQHLHVQQNLGIEQLKARHNAFVFQHSQLQGRYLANRGINMEQVFKLCPPIHAMQVTDYSAMDETMRTAVDSAKMLLFTAVARIDCFKDIDLLVDVAIQLYQQNVPITVLIAGDDEGNTGQRQRLYERIPMSYRGSFFIVPKLRKDVLHTLFKHCRHNGVFICPSRYETLGITPLESGLHGVTTLISNSKQVEASRFFPDNYRFHEGNLGKTIKSFEKTNLYKCGRLLQRHLEKNISKESFESDFLNA